MHAGLLEPVSNLSVTPVNSTTIIISWIPPITLEGVPILGYHVTINTSVGTSDTILVKSKIMLYHFIEHTGNTLITMVTVVPINGGGVGKYANYTAILYLLISTSELHAALILIIASDWLKGIWLSYICMHYVI